MSNSPYPFTILGPGSIPKDGPCVLCVNLVSLHSVQLMRAVAGRRIVFLLPDDLRKDTRFAPGDAPCFGTDAVDQAREALKNNEIVCLFPEQCVTGNGTMGFFTDAHERLYAALGAEAKNVPFICVCLGRLFGREGTRGAPHRQWLDKTLPLDRLTKSKVSVYIDKARQARDFSPFALRLHFTEMAAEIESAPYCDEEPFHAYFTSHVKKCRMEDAFGTEMNGIKMWVGAALLSREIKKREKGGYVAILLPSCVAAPLCFLAALMADKIPALLNFTAAPDTIEHAVDSIGKPIILTSKKFLPRIKWRPKENLVFLEDLVPHFTKWQKIAMLLRYYLTPKCLLKKQLFPKSYRDVNRPAVILFSSGSAGTPKNIQLTHRNLTADALGMQDLMGLRANDCYLGTLPLFHSYGFTSTIIVPILTGAQAVFTPSPLDCDAVGNAAQKYKVSLLLGTPTFLNLYLHKCKPEQLATLRIAVGGGEKMRPEFVEAFMTRFGLKPFEGFGATELSPVVTINTSNEIAEYHAVPGKDNSIGPGLPNIAVKIVNPETFELLPPNTEGLFLVKGPTVMKGYLNAEALTESVIKDHWYNTGDIAKMDEDGYIYITGRYSRFSKIGGEMVPHEKIEQLLVDSTPLVTERTLAVGACADISKGERLIVVYTDHAPMSPAEYVDYLRGKNVPNLWIPKAQDFIRVETIPLLGNGKLDLQGLKTLIQEITK